MSGNSGPSLKQILFDAAIFSYTVMLLAYAFCTTAAPSVLDQEYFTANFDSFAKLGGLVFIACAFVAWFASNKNVITAGEALFASGSRRQFIQQTQILRTFYGAHLIFVLLATLWVSARVTEASITELLDRDGLTGAWRLWTGIAQPNFNLLAKAIAEAVETIFIAFLATAISIPLAFVLAFFCAKNIMNHPAAFFLYGTLRLGMNISRSVEPLVWALIFTVWVGVGPFAGMLALMIHSIASLTKYYSEILESVDEKPIDGLKATGASSVQVIWFAVVPQIILPYIGMTIYRWDTNVRMATVIGLVGGGGIGTLLIQYQGQAMWPEVGCIILVIAFVVWLMDLASAYVREALK